jgi:WD40 repeat protein
VSSARGTFSPAELAEIYAVNERVTSRHSEENASPDGSILAAAGQDSVVRLWSVPGLQQVASVSAIPQELSGNAAELVVNEAAFGPGGHTLVSANSDGTAQVWDLKSADAVRDLCGALGPAWVAGQWPGLDPGSGHDPCSPG